LTGLTAFVDAVRGVADGGTALDPEVVAQLFSRQKPDGPLERLTPRELEVLARMAEGRSNAKRSGRPTRRVKFRRCPGMS
jgi:DNA-binding NarL/FixJ family response regulator